MPGYSFLLPHPQLADVVEAIWDHDVPETGFAPTIIMPGIWPTLCFHYRVPPGISFGHQPSTTPRGWIQPGRYRITGSQSRAARLRPSGPVGGVMVRLRPETAARLTGSDMSSFQDSAFSLEDVFDPTSLSLLTEQLAEAPDYRGRIAAVEMLLLRYLRDDRPDDVTRRAARCLRRDPGLSIGSLASRFDCSERHLSRQFRRRIGISPKRFARIVRIGKTISCARGTTTDWAAVALSCGFADQPHMIKEFDAMVGRPPDAFFRLTSLGHKPAAPTSSAESDFYNTFVSEMPTLAPAEQGEPARTCG
jgi:AraC-like DNA-binding protein